MANKSILLSVLILSFLIGSFSRAKEVEDLNTQGHKPPQAQEISLSTVKAEPYSHLKNILKETGESQLKDFERKFLKWQPIQPKIIEPRPLEPCPLTIKYDCPPISTQELLESIISSILTNEKNQA